VVEQEEWVVLWVELLVVAVLRKYLISLIKSNMAEAQINRSADHAIQFRV
jgi:hypothetical protein